MAGLRHGPGGPGPKAPTKKRPPQGLKETIKLLNLK